MNAVEIEEAVSAPAAQPIDPEEFPFTFLQAFGNKQTTLLRLQGSHRQVRPRRPSNPQHPVQAHSAAYPKMLLGPKAIALGRPGP